MQDRANKVCDSTSKTTELQHLQDVFQDNGFPMDLLRKDLAVLSCCGTETAGELMDGLLGSYLPQDNTPKVLCTPDIKGPNEKTEKV